MSVVLSPLMLALTAWGAEWWTWRPLRRRPSAQLFTPPSEALERRCLLGDEPLPLSRTRLVVGEVCRLLAVLCLVVHYRHSWFGAGVYALCGAVGVGGVLRHLPRRATPVVLRAVLPGYSFAVPAPVPIPRIDSKVLVTQALQLLFDTDDEWSVGVPLAVPLGPILTMMMALSPVGSAEASATTTAMETVASTPALLVGAVLLLAAHRLALLPKRGQKHPTAPSGLLALEAVWAVALAATSPPALVPPALLLLGCLALTRQRCV